MIKQEKKMGFVLALLEIAQEEKKQKEIFKQAKIIIDSIDQNPELTLVMDDQSLDFLKKQAIIKKIYKSIHWSLLNTIYLLIEKNDFKSIRYILIDLNKQLSDILNIQEGIVYSSNPISKSEIQQIEKKLTKQFNKKVVLKNYIDKELIGGFRIEIDDNVIESSIKANLNNLKESLLNNSNKET